MNFIDIIIIILVLILCIRGYLKGFINELFSLLIIGVGLVGAFLFYRPLSEVFLEFMESSDVALVLSFFALFILISIFLIIIRNIVVQFRCPSRCYSRFAQGLGSLRCNTRVPQTSSRFTYR